MRRSSIVSTTSSGIPSGVSSGVSSVHSHGKGIHQSQTPRPQRGSPGLSSSGYQSPGSSVGSRHIEVRVRSVQERLSSAQHAQASSDSAPASAPAPAPDFDEGSEPRAFIKPWETFPVFPQWKALKQAELSLVAAERLFSALQSPCFDSEDRLLGGAHVNAARTAVLEATDGLKVMSKRELELAKRMDDAEQRRRALVQASKEGVLRAEDDIFHILVRKQLKLHRALEVECKRE